MTPFDTEWLNQNHFRAYPLEDNASRTSADGYVLPNEVLLDLVLLSFPSDSLPLYISQVTITNTIFEMRIADSTGMLVTSILVNVSLHSDPQSYFITGLGTYANIRGHVVLGDLQGALQAGVGAHAFTSAATRLLGTCVLPATPRVDSLAAKTVDGQISTGLIGPVVLKEGNNIRITQINEENALKIDCVQGLTADCSCDDPFCGAEKPISRINGIGADSGCNVNIRGIGCIKVTVQGNTIVIEDTCTSPGCGDCQSFQEMLNQLEQLEGACTGGGAGTGGTDPGNGSPFIYEVNTPIPKVFVNPTVAVAPGNTAKEVVSSNYNLTNYPSNIQTADLLALHNETDAAATGAGVFPVRDGDAVNLVFKVKNDTLNDPKGWQFISAPANLLVDLASMGLAVSGLGTDTVTISGNIDFSSPVLAAFAVQSTGAFPFLFWFTSPNQPPYNSGYTGKIFLTHEVILFLRGLPQFGD